MITNQRTLNHLIKNIEKEPLHIYTNHIVSDGFLIVENEKNIGTLFFKKGQLVNGEINNKFGKDKASQIKSWEKVHYFFQKWQKHFKIESKYISKLFYFIEFLSLNAKISFNIKDQSFIFLFSEGAIVNINPEINNTSEIIELLKKLPKEAIIKIEKTKINTGNLKIFFSELNINKQLQNKEIKPDISVHNNIISHPKEDENKIINKLKNIQSSFNTIKYIYSTKDSKEIFSKNFTPKQKQHLNSLKKIITESTNNNKLTSSYLIIEMEENILISFFFENYNIFIMFDKKNINFGIMFNILIPSMLNITSK